MDPFNDELDLALLQFEDLKLNSDHMTFLISHLLRESGLFHQSRVGCVRDNIVARYITPHCWIELTNGAYIDLTLRRSLYDEENIPHGLFNPAIYPDISYTGLPVKTPKITKSELIVMSNGKYQKVLSLLQNKFLSKHLISL
jgi:hypothetical protein